MAIPEFILKSLRKLLENVYRIRRILRLSGEFLNREGATCWSGCLRGQDLQYTLHSFNALFCGAEIARLSFGVVMELVFQGCEVLRLGWLEPLHKRRQSAMAPPPPPPSSIHFVFGPPLLGDSGRAGAPQALVSIRDACSPS
jgi:hypothetical protein